MSDGLLFSDKLENTCILSLINDDVEYDNSKKCKTKHIYMHMYCSCCVMQWPMFN